jgi:pectin methylesterase-like acyl-CoA thioesterase
MPSATARRPKQNQVINVAADGSAPCSSIQCALDAAPPGATIQIAPGVYREALRITQPKLRLVGIATDPAQTVVVEGRSAATTGSTFQSATVEVRGDDFQAENLTFANDYTLNHVQTKQGSQALALLVTGDRAVFRQLRLLGHQDTLYAGSGHCTPPPKTAEPCAPARQYFVDSYIEGNVDFIFGNAKAVFERCEIRSLSHSIGFVTAQAKHYPTQDSGFVFNRCRLTADPDVAHVWLGRPWRRYASVVFLDSTLGAHVEPAGWREWHPGETDFLETAFYAEARSSGPGASPEARDPHLKQLTPAQAARFATRRFLVGKDGWDPTRIR